MNRKSTVVPVVLGLVGLGLHGWAKHTGFTPDSHLPVSQNPVWLCILIFTVLVPILALSLAFPLSKAKKNPDRPLYASAGPVGRTNGMLAGGFTLLGGGFALFDEMSYAQSTHNWSEFLPILICGMLALSGLVMLRSSLLSPQKRRGAEALIPGFSAAFWLILYYHTHGQDPIVARYSWVLVGLMALSLAMYLLAGYAFGLIHPYWSYVCAASAGAWCLAASISCTEPGYPFLMVGFAIWCFWHCDLVLCQANPPGARQQPEEDIH